MNQNYQLCSPWCVWLGYQVPEEKSTKAGYNDTLKKVHVIKSYNDLVFYWQESRFNNILEFLVQEQDATHNKVSSYEIDGKSCSISAINYFREGINPTWEDENNKNGGRLIFQIDKQNEKYQKIYEWLIFYFLGESEKCAEDINGVRFISHKPTAPVRFHFRVEVWTKFDLAQEGKVVLFRDTFVNDFANEFLEPNAKVHFKPTFKSNREEEKGEKGHEKDHKGYEKDTRNKH